MSTPTPPTGIASPRSSASWQLVTAAQAGDRGAFATLYRTYAPGLYRYLRARLRNQAVAEDLASETFLRALRSLHTVTYQGRDVGAWLTTIAANLIRDQLKSARYRNELLDHDTASTQVAHANPESIVVHADEAHRLQEALAHLTAEQRKCLLLRFFHDFSIAETATAMNRDINAVKALQHRAIRRLAALFGRERADPAEPDRERSKHDER